MIRRPPRSTLFPYTTLFRSAAPVAADRGAGVTRTAYQNPVSKDFADTFADPAVIRGKDGYWYAYGTTDPLKEGDPDRNLIPIMRSDDLVNWEYVGDAFTEATKPAWAEPDAALWADRKRRRVGKECRSRW